MERQDCGLMCPVHPPWREQGITAVDYYNVSELPSFPSYSFMHNMVGLTGIKCVNFKNKVIFNQYHDTGFHLQYSLQTVIFHKTFLQHLQRSNTSGLLTHTLHLSTPHHFSTPEMMTTKSLQLNTHPLTVK